MRRPRGRLHADHPVRCRSGWAPGRAGTAMALASIESSTMAWDGAVASGQDFSFVPVLLSLSEREGGYRLVSKRERRSASAGCRRASARRRSGTRRGTRDQPGSSCAPRRAHEFLGFAVWRVRLRRVPAPGPGRGLRLLLHRGCWWRERRSLRRREGTGCRLEAPIGSRR